MKKLLSVLIVALFVLAFVIPAFAEVDVKSSGAKVTTAVAVDFYGPTVTKVGGNAIVNYLAVTGNQVVTGNQTVTGNSQINGTADVDSKITVDGDIYANAGVIVDGSIYAATTDGGATGGAGLYLSQPDGGCSKCYVDAGGTTFACANITCPAGMN